MNFSRGSHSALWIFLAIALISISLWTYKADFSTYALSRSLIIELYSYSITFSLAGIALLVVLRSKETGISIKLPIFYNSLRVSIGILLITDGILQLQPQMPFGFAHFVLGSSAANLPGWLFPLTTSLITFWTSHEIILDAASGSFQIFLGSAFLLLRTESAIRLVSVATLLWSIGLWAFGEGAGGILSSGLSFITGFPGAALIYAFISVILLLRASERTAIRTTCIFMAALFLLSAIVQAFPYEGFWSSGSIHLIAAGNSVNLQPNPLISLLTFFSKVFIIPGVPWNLIFITLFALTGVAWLIRARIAAAFTVLLSLIVWIFGQDFGIFGFYSTDLNTAPVLILVSLSVLTATNLAETSEETSQSESTSDAKST